MTKVFLLILSLPFRSFIGVFNLQVSFDLVLASPLDISIADQNYSWAS